MAGDQRRAMTLLPLRQAFSFNWRRGAGPVSLACGYRRRCRIEGSTVPSLGLQVHGLDGIEKFPFATNHSGSWPIYLKSLEEVGSALHLAQAFLVQYSRS